ncbi:DUF6494 family protein [Aestuariispira ectoiniformans]|uniref:DUF6494 family protein n=1 Tax=Aestuariispira ectoiniformans TaxID=2775080 RepID=UPI00223C4E2A|nr:DUF6494 family protein [Aestuariispira ectoiniformans]
MNEDVFNMSTRKFLKKIGVNAQREIEKAVWKAVEDGTLADNQLPAQVRLTVAGIALDITIDGMIDLE